MSESTDRRLLAHTAIELGEGLKRLRTRTLPSGRVIVVRSLRALEKSPSSVSGAFFTRSTLGRLENGQSLPRLDQADDLDSLYGAGGWVIESLKNIYRSGWTSSSSAASLPRRNYTLLWPSTYRGDVWIHVEPSSESVGKIHELRIAWGPWKNYQKRQIDHEGVWLVTGKAADVSGESTPLTLISSEPIHCTYGMTEIIVSSNVIDIRNTWAWRWESLRSVITFFRR